MSSAADPGWYHHGESEAGISRHYCPGCRNMIPVGKADGKFVVHTRPSGQCVGSGRLPPPASPERPADWT